MKTIENIRFTHDQLGSASARFVVGRDNPFPTSARDDPFPHAASWQRPRLGRGDPFHTKRAWPTRAVRRMAPPS